MPNMNMEVIASFVDRLSGPAREAAQSLNSIKTAAEGIGQIGEHFTRATNGLRGAGTIFKNAGEGAGVLASHLKTLEGINVAPKLVAIGKAAEDMKEAGGIFRSAGKGAETLATGIKALEGLDGSKVTAIAEAMGKMRAAGGGGEGAMAGDMTKFASESVKGATAVERIEKALAGAAAHMAALAASPGLSGLGGLPAGPGAGPRMRPGVQGDGEQRGVAIVGPWGSRAPGQAPGTSVPTIPMREPPIEAPRPVRAPRDAMSAAGITLPERSGISGAAGHHTFMDDVAKAHHRHLTNEIGGAVQLGVQPLILSEFAKSVFEQGAELDKEVAVGKANGLSDDLVAGVLKKAQNVARSVPQTDIAGNFKAIMALRMATGGNLDEAESIFGKIAKAGVYVGSMTGKKQTGDTFAEAAYDMVRTGELKGDITDPKKFDSLIESIARTTIYSEGKVTPQSYHATAVYLRGALQGLSDEFFNNKLPFIAQELASHGVAGSQAGSAIAQVSQVVGNSGVFSKNVENWIKFGLADPGKVTDRGTGKAKFQPDALYNRDMERRDPQEYAAWVKKKIEDHGFTTKDQQIDALNMLSGNLKFKQAMEIMMFQDERMGKFSENQGKVLGIDQGYALFGGTMSGAQAGLMGRFHSAEQTAGASAAPFVVPVIKGVSAIIDRFNSDMGGGGDETARPMAAVNDLVTGARALTALGSAPVINPFLRGITAVASKLPMFGGMIGEAAPILGRLAVGANPFLNGAYFGTKAYQFMATPNTLGMGEGFDDARSKAIDAANLAKRMHTDYANAGPDILPTMKTVDTVKPPEPVKLPDATPAGATAGNQIAAGVASAAGAVAAQAEALMAKIRSILGGGVNVPVNLQSSGVPAAAGAVPGKQSSLSPAVKAGAVGGTHLASAGSVTHVNNSKTHVAINVTGGNDPKATAKAVHEVFKTAARAQLSDGVYS